MVSPISKKSCSKIRLSADILLRRPHLRERHSGHREARVIQVHYSKCESSADDLFVQCLSSQIIQVTARTALVGQEEHQFLVIEKELWSPATALHGSKISKLEEGHYVWPFEFTLPEEVEVLDQKEKKTFPLPPSFTERASPACISYRITVILRQGALGVNQSCVLSEALYLNYFIVRSLKTEFAYFPITRPDPPSHMLQKAYKENIPLVGPEGLWNYLIFNVMSNFIQVIPRGGTPFHQPVSLALFLGRSR